MMRRSFGAPTLDITDDDPARPAPASSPAADDAPLRTRFAFTLPRGYVDSSGRVHREGVMRMATARDELLPVHDDRVREHPAYATVVLLARVIERIGEITDIHAGLVENLFAADLAFLQDLYRRINTDGHTLVAVSCPSCGHDFHVDVSGRRQGEP